MRADRRRHWCSRSVVFRLIIIERPKSSCHHYIASKPRIAIDGTHKYALTSFVLVVPLIVAKLALFTLSHESLNTLQTVFGLSSQILISLHSRHEWHKTTSLRLYAAPRTCSREIQRRLSLARFCDYNRCGEHVQRRTAQKKVYSL